MQQADMDAMGLQYMYARAVACYWYTSGIQYSTSSIRNHMSVVGYGFTRVQGFSSGLQPYVFRNDSEAPGDIVTYDIGELSRDVRYYRYHSTATY